MNTARQIALDATDADALVLAHRRLRDGVRVETTARFGDDCWDLAPTLLQKHQRRLILNFAGLDRRYRRVAKDYCYNLLAGQPPEGQPQLTIATIRLELSRFKIFTDWLATQGSPRLVDVSVEQVDAYRRELIRRNLSSNWRGGLRRAVRNLWIYREYLPTDRLTFDPAGLPSWDEPHNRPATENATGRVPEAVLGPLLGWALRFVEEFSTDILNARSEWAALNSWYWGRRVWDRSPDGPRPGPGLRRVLARYRRDRRALPGGTAGVNLAHLAREAGVSRHALTTSPYDTLIDNAITELGIDDDAYLWTPMTVEVAGRPWLQRIPYQAYRQLEQRLNAACYIVIAYLSGMRDSEIKHLRRGCLTIGSTSEQLVRHKVTSLAFKGERAAEGVEATWVVGAPVAHAIQVLEQIQPADQDLLFAPLLTSHHRRGRTNPVLSSRASNDDIAGLITWVNTYCAERGLPDRIPDISGQPPTVITRQFRRTLAWFIARRPGGVIAGAIAYRHHSVQMFEGYSGTSASGFRAEAESELALARGEDLALMVERHDHERLTGPAAESGQLRLREFGDRVRLQGVTITDRRQLTKLLAHHDPRVYPGRYVTCVYNADRALCHSGRQSGPSLGDCQPLACRNVALTDGNDAQWQGRLDELDTALGHEDTLAPYVADRLRTRREQITRLLAPRPPHEL